MTDLEKTKVFLEDLDIGHRTEECGPVVDGSRQCCVHIDEKNREFYGCSGLCVTFDFDETGEFLGLGADR